MRVERRAWIRYAAARYLVTKVGSVINRATGAVRRLKTSRPRDAGVPYLEFSMYYKGKVVTIKVHQLAGFQLFGSKAFAPGVDVCHIDGDSMNNRDDNFKLGTKKHNAADRERHRSNRLAMMTANPEEYEKGLPQWE